MKTNGDSISSISIKTGNGLAAAVTQNDGNGEACQPNGDDTLQHEYPVHHGIFLWCIVHLNSRAHLDLYESGRRSKAFYATHKTYQSLFLADKFYALDGVLQHRLKNHNHFLESRKHTSNGEVVTIPVARNICFSKPSVLHSPAS